MSADDSNACCGPTRPRVAPQTRTQCAAHPDGTLPTFFWCFRSRQTIGRILSSLRSLRLLRSVYWACGPLCLLASAAAHPRSDFRSALPRFLPPRRCRVLVGLKFSHPSFWILTPLF